MKHLPVRCHAYFRYAFILSLLGSLRALTAVSAAPARDLGVDVSHYQGASGISQNAWNQMYAEGKRFAFIKASEGLTGPDDAAMANNVTRATSAGLLVGVYHYAHPENRTNTTGGIQEANHFITYAGSAIGPGRLRPVLDLEGSSANLSTAGLTDWVIAFSNEIIAQRGRGSAPIIYMNRSFARFEVDARMANYDLWLAYPTNVDVLVSEPPPTGSYPDPTGVFNNWAFWQYSWTGASGGINPLDLNICHNEYKPLTSFIIPTPSPTFTINSTNMGPGGFRLSFTNVPGTHFTILATTNILLPLNTWTVLGAAVESANGLFQFTDTNVSSKVRNFYRVRSP